jgi:bifunctional non-homologous end joining protein LigD
MSSQFRPLPRGFIEPCRPTSSPTPPSGEEWAHEIMHDGLRIIARKEDKRIRLYGRMGNDLTDRFPLIVEAMTYLGANSCTVDGEAVACGEDGIASFDRISYWRNGNIVFLYAFDLIELNGSDLRREPFVVRKATLASLLGQEMIAGLLGSATPGLRFNEHIEADGPTVFQHACKLGLEGIVSKRKDSYYVSGRSLYWIKSKNPDAPAAKRAAEIDCSG